MMVLDADMAIFFSSIDQICTLNQQILDHFSRHVEDVLDDEGESDHVFRPGAIFSAYAPLFQLYTSYASRHEAALNVIESPQFASFLKEMPAEASVNRLRTYLNMPMERIPRYKVFLQELLECTPNDHIDFVPLQTAIKSVDMVANKVQEIIARRESAKKLDEISARVGIDLRGRRYVFDGLLRKVCRSKVLKYYFVLLDDAIVYGRTGGGLQKRKFRLIELWECKVSSEASSVPHLGNSGSKTCSAFSFFSPLKSFILVAESEEDKSTWISAIQTSIDKTLRNPRLSRRASIRSELLLDEDESTNECELEGAFVIKDGWLNVITEDSRRCRRMWITLNMQTISLATAYHGAQPEETLSIGCCEAVPMKELTFFRIYVRTDTVSSAVLSSRESKPSD
ncbi:hypothetical protein PINS_up010062 [Pythium insidiosum]|nr:hypothetical protein PINS_up010062 [Pythium insidiosum]